MSDGSWVTQGAREIEIGEGLIYIVLEIASVYWWLTHLSFSGVQKSAPFIKAR